MMWINGEMGDGGDLLGAEFHFIEDAEVIFDRAIAVFTFNAIHSLFSHLTPVRYKNQRGNTSSTGVSSQ